MYHRPDCPPEIAETVAKIVADVKENGNHAIEQYLKNIDGVTLSADQFAVTEEEYREAAKFVDAVSRKAMRTAIKNIRAFALQTLPEDWKFSPRPGVIQGERFTPMERVGCYVPGGTAPLVSTVIHTIAIAKAAGVREIVAITPPMKNGKINPATLYAMKLAGATEVYKMGGAYAVAALGYGTETIRKVDKLVGPGNAYVAAAKKIVYGNTAIDMVAGPSEIMVVVDQYAPKEFAAADMLSQAEHGSGLEQAVLVSDSVDQLLAIRDEIYRQAETLSRQGPLSKVLANGVFLIQAENMQDAAEIAGNYAPEHLELMCRNAAALSKKIKAAGAIFLGNWTPEPAGDFTAGPSHVLPTAGTAKFFHGISAADFMRRSSIIQYTRNALMKEVDDIAQFAKLEGLDAHGRSATIRRDLKK